MEKEQNNIESRKIDESVRPEFKEKLAKAKHLFKDFPEDDFTEKRKEFHEMLKDFPTYTTDKVVVETRNIPGPEDAPEIFIRIYRPKNTSINGGKDKVSDKLPGVLWIHGGGQLFGHTDFTTYWCTHYAEQVNCIAVALDYRLTPESPYPASLEDCYATLVWMSKAEGLEIDTDRIAVGGDSAGGCLTAALCLLTRDRKGPKICFQMPLYPMLDDRNVTPSSYEITDERGWNRQVNIAAWKMYLKNLKDNEEIPIYAAPTRAKDLSNLPPAFTFIGELDMFRDETIDYVQRLMQAGVPVEFHIYSGCTHSFEWIFSESDFAKQVLMTNILALKNAFIHLD